MSNAPRLPRIEIYRDHAHEWRWRLISGTRIVADGGEGYVRKSGALRAVQKLAETVRLAHLEIREPA